MAIIVLCLLGRSGVSKSHTKNPFSLSEGQINIGDEYQADIPDCDPDDCLLQYMQEEATDKRQSICVWKGPDAEDMLTEEQIRDFCIVARERYHFNVEQALGILQYANMDVERAMKSLEDYRSMPDEWSRSDKILFEQAFAFNGKIFRRIKQMVTLKAGGSARAVDKCTFLFSSQIKRFRTSSNITIRGRKSVKGKRVSLNKRIGNGNRLGKVVLS